MALNFFRQRDIDQMDINDIPEEFLNYFETLDDNGKAALVGSRPELAKALGFILPETESVDNSAVPTSEPKMEESSVITREFYQVEKKEKNDYSEEEELPSDDLDQIRQNYYEGKNLDKVLKVNMSELEALAIPDKATSCMLHRTPLESKQIYFRDLSAKPTYGIILKVCRKCHRVYLEESKMLPIHEALVARRVPHTFYDLNLTTQYLQSQVEPHEFSADEVLQIPDTWIEEDLKCPIHKASLYEVPCVKRYKGREVRFTAYRCDRCGKYLMRQAAAIELLDRCAEAGIPQIETERLVKEEPARKTLPYRKIVSDYLIENGKRTEYRYSVQPNCYQLTEDDTVIVSDSIYCAIDGHAETKEVVALIWVLQKKGGRRAYLFKLGYCTDCQKYYMAEEDYRVLYEIGRPEVSILRDIDETDLKITSGEVFNLERKHLETVENQITAEILTIKSQDDYVSPYAVGDYDDGALSFAKARSTFNYGPLLDDLYGYAPKPYSYRVDISYDGQTETYYVGAADIVLNGKQQVISANSSFGHDLINYQTIKVKKGRKEYSIKLSRQFDINNASLFGYLNLRTDEDIIFKSGITDPFLVRVLNMRKRQHNLTDIFVTIQENQNRIVNVPFSKSIIVQGCAGSGKTMVLLHRLSSLNYKEKNFSFSRDAMILTPNDQFSLHIKGLAEELQIGSINRVSVEQYYIDTLLDYSEDFKPSAKLVSEMNVRQIYVDYIYSDEFREDFDEAYCKVIEERNSLVVILNNLLKAMGQSPRTIDLSDDSKVVQQIRYAVDTMNSLVKGRESEANAAAKEYQECLTRKQYLQKRLQEIGDKVVSVVADSIPRVNTKIGVFLSEKQQTISNLEGKIERLNKKRDEVQKRVFSSGKLEELEKLDDEIQKTEEKLEEETRNQEKYLPILSQPIDGLSEDEALVWMRRVMQIVPKVQEDVRLCNNIREENQRLSEEWAGIEARLETARLQDEEKKAVLYSEEVKKKIADFYSALDQYSMLKTYQLIFNQAVAPIREVHSIKNIVGKYHRYDLYAQLLFAMRYFGKAVGNVRFMCIDEGQDLAFNEYRLLYELNQKKVVFNVFGDVNQLIKQGRGISDWNELKRLFKADIYRLNENYRNTNQITRFCNSIFNMTVTQTGVDGVNVREIPRKDLESELAALSITSERVAILVPRGVQKKKYLKEELLPDSIVKIIGDKMDNGFIAFMYVDEVKGIEFDKAYVVSNKMSRNEKYIAYTRALSELILVVDDEVADYDDGSSQEKSNKKAIAKAGSLKSTNQKGVLNYKRSYRKRTVTKVKADQAKVALPDREEKKPVLVEEPVPLKEEKTIPLEAIEKSVPEVAPEEDNAPDIPAALKELPQGYVEINAKGAVNGVYYLVPYKGKLRNYTTKKAISMFMPQMRSGKLMKVPVSVVEEDRIVFITKELFKMHEKALKLASEVELLS